MISFRIDWFGLLAVQGILKSLLQHRNSKTSILQLSAFFMVQLSHQYMTTRKTIGLAIWTFVGKVMSLLFNMLSRFVIVFLLRSNRLLISWLQSLSTPLSLHNAVYLKKVAFTYIHHCTIALISHASKVMLKNLQARLQQYVNAEIPGVQAGFRKRRVTRDQVANIHWIIEKARVPEKHPLLLY